jgi:hypothetical protein
MNTETYFAAPGPHQAGREPTPDDEPGHTDALDEPQPQPHSRIERLVSLCERITLPPLEREPRLWAQIVLLVVVLILAGLAARADADTLRVGVPRYINGSYAVTARASAPPQTDYASDLYRGRCPRQPAYTDVFTPVQHGSSLLHAWPPNGETGRFRLCVWIWRQDSTVTARYEHAVVLPKTAAGPPPFTLVTINSHPERWIPVGTGGLVGLMAAIIAIPLVIGLLIAVLVRRLKRRRRSRHSPEQRRREAARLDELHERAQSDSPDLGEEHPTEDLENSAYAEDDARQPPDREDGGNGEQAVEPARAASESDRDAEAGAEDPPADHGEPDAIAE